MRFKILAVIVLFLFIGSVALSEEVHLTIKYVEQTLEGRQSVEKLREVVLTGQELKNAKVEVITFRNLPIDGGSSKYQFSSAKRYDLGEVEGLGNIQISAGVQAKPVRDKVWKISFDLDLGEEIPFLVKQKRSSSEKGKSKADEIYTQRSRRVGLSINEEVEMELGSKAIVHENISKSEDSTVCRYVLIELQKE